MDMNTPYPLGLAYWFGDIIIGVPQFKRDYYPKATFFYHLAKVGTRHETNIVLIVEDPANKGVSITTVSPYIAQYIVRRHKLDQHRTIWIEHYPASTRIPESWSLITYEWPYRDKPQKPNWSPISRAGVASLLGITEEN